MLSTLRPLLQAEFRHQRYVIEQGRVGVIWIVLAALLLIPAALATLHYMWLAISTTEDQLVLATRVALNEGLWVAVLLVGVISLYVVVTLITFGLASNSITREKRSHTWDNLRLTSVHPWNIVLGKWLGSLRAVNGDHGMSVFLRLGFISLVMIVLPALLPDAYPLTTAGVVLAWGLTLVFGLLDAGLTAALGVLSALYEDTVGVVMGMLLVGVRGTVTLLALAWTLLVVSTAVPTGLMLGTVGMVAYVMLIAGALLIARYRVV